MKTKLPNFLIVGAAKSGTSSLHNYLNQHPEVFMCSPKEPHFLIKNLVKNRLHNGVWSWEEYKSLFANVKNEKAIGESSVLYLYYHKEAIKNIKQRLGEKVKIVIMLRNPVDRAFSAYTHVARSVKENLTFEKALEIEEERLLNDKTLTPMVMYKEMGLYYDMLKAYQHNFKHVFVIIHEDFQNNTAEVVEQTLVFLGIFSSAEIDTKSRHNVGGKRWKKTLLKQFFMKDNFLKKVLRVIFSKNARKKFRLFIESFLKEKSKPINPETKKELLSYFKNDIERLSFLLKRDLKNWTL
jgi:hypothetical protein